MSFIIKTAKTVEEAIDAGLLELGVSRDEVQVEVIEEAKSGFLGLIGQKDAMVKLKIKNDISSFVRDILYDDKSEKKQEVKKEKPENKEIKEPIEVTEKTEIIKEDVKPIEKEEKLEIKSKSTTKYNNHINDYNLDDDFDDDDDDIDDEEDFENEEGFEKVIWSDEELEVKIEEFMKTVLDEFKIDYDFTSSYADQKVTVDVSSSNPSSLGIVIGKKGSTINSIQYLLGQVINKHRNEFIRVEVDANGYRAKRRANLEQIAKRGLAKLNKYNRPVKLEPMNAADRRIVHLVLQDYEDIKTHSEGWDPYRRVVISKKN